MKHLRRGFLIAFGIFAALIFLELVLRLGGWTLSSLQERWNARSVAREAACRILCLGESTTAPMGVPDNSYPRQLQEVLDRRGRGVRFSVVNGGAVGATTTRIIERLEENLERYRPAVVVTMMGINDGEGYIFHERGGAAGRPDRLRRLQVWKFFVLLRGALEEALEGARVWLVFSIGTAQDRESLSQRVSSLRKQGLYGEASDLLERMLARDPQSEPLSIDLADCYRRQGRYGEAERLLQEILRRAPDNLPASAELAVCCREEGRYGEAVGLLEGVLKRESGGERPAAPKDGETRREEYLRRTAVELAECYQRESRYTEAETLLQSILKRDPTDEWAILRLAGCYRLQERYMEEKAVLERFLSRRPPAGRNSEDAGGTASPQAGMREARAMLLERLLLSGGTREEIKKAGWDESAITSLPMQRSRRTFGLASFLLAPEGGAGSNPAAAARESFRYRKQTEDNYKRLAAALKKRGIVYICMQYPMRSVEPLRELFDFDPAVTFVDNEKTFKEAVRREGVAAYFTDLFGGDFGHCTDLGNRLIAENLAAAVLRKADPEAAQVALRR